MNNLPNLPASTFFLGETVTLSCALEDDLVAFSVHNPGVMSADAQLLVFQRSFTTKGLGRGLGTYSMQLLSSYLGGEVSFTTSEEAGTRFVGRFARNSNRE